MKTVWSIAGSDSSACAGLQVDLKTFHHFGVHGCAVTTVVTAQHSAGVTAVYPLPAAFIATQLNTLKLSHLPQALKIGMLGNKEITESVIDFLKHYTGYVVIDPVMTASAGQVLTAEYNAAIFAYAEVITPNIPEVEKILNCKITAYVDIEIAAKQLLMLGAKSVFIKGGHFFNTDAHLHDYWTNGITSFWLSTPRQSPHHYRGTGCILSAAITACLALGYEIKDAIVIAKMYVNRSIRLATKLSCTIALPTHNAWPEEEIDLPYLSPHPLLNPPQPFPACATQLTLYPIVDSIEWLEKLSALDIKTCQLRIKNQWGSTLENTIQRSIALAQQHHITLWINDYWQLAIKHGAYGVHLGQEDLNTADLNAIYQAGLRLGISTHCYYEVARAHALNPSYIACGPIFTTTSKMMPFSPQGIAQLKRWRKTLAYPLVAIGGIGIDNIDAVAQTQVNSIAMISAITAANHPLAMAKMLLEKVEAYVTLCAAN